MFLSVNHTSNLIEPSEEAVGTCSVQWVRNTGNKLDLRLDLKKGWGGEEGSVATQNL